VTLFGIGWACGQPFGVPQQLLGLEYLPCSEQGFIFASLEREKSAHNTAFFGSTDNFFVCA
jgi:hypothetical protein